jgi:2-keto-4-pentenoate hydratase/2-oxohepta-3-ene-1,7-dioic acid hydratase in catechol pathway
VRLASFRTAGDVRPGIIRGDRIIDAGSLYPSVEAIVAAGEQALAEVREIQDADGILLDDAELAAPLLPRSVYCVGWNYLKHFEEGAAKRDEELPEHPAFFSKSLGSVVGPHDEVPLHEAVTKKLDYEVELTVVIGREGSTIDPGNALEHVFGYTVGNDVSAREVQRRHGGQWLKGKGLDGTCPLGPWIVTRDEVPDPQALEVISRVNGEERQRSTTALMMFPVADLISRLSEGMTLYPGDVLLTGTPEGVGMGMDPQVWLADGDVVECEITAIGALRNVIRASASP